MENLGHDVVDTTLEVASGSACPIKKALPFLLPTAVFGGLAFLLVKFVKKAKAKKASTTIEELPEEVNPEV